MNEWMSVKELQMLCGRLDFMHIYMINVNWFSGLGLAGRRVL